MTELITIQPRMNGKGYQLYLKKIDFILDALGEMTVDQIRKLLQLNGAQGLTSNGCGCPLAVYMNRTIGRKVWIESARAIPIVGKDSLPDDALDTDDPRARDLPLSVRDFIRNFDSGRFPELELNR